MQKEALVDKLRELRLCIEDAEHKPGAWEASRSTMGGISSRLGESDLDAQVALLSLTQTPWAGFSFKRDAWLAVAAVNALPMLMAIVESVLDQAEGTGADAELARGLLARASDNPGWLSRNVDAPSGTEVAGEECLRPESTMAGAVSEGAQMIVAERQRHLTDKGWTAEHDDQHIDQSMAMVCALYAAPVRLYEMTGGGRSYHFVDPWPGSWGSKWDRRRVDQKGQLKERSLDEQVEDLTKAGALAAAEIDRLLRMKRRQSDPASRACGS